jgi:hypothetical protein
MTENYRTLRIAIIGFLSLLATTASPVLAQSSASPTPDAPDPALCMVEPRSLEDLNQVLATPIVQVTRTPGVVPDGAPADPEQIAGITATLREFVACFNAGELLRAYGLYTDRYFHQVFAREGQMTVEAYDALATPEPEDPDFRSVILDVRDVRVLETGGVGATVTIEYAVIPMPKTFFFTFVFEQDRWWIDGILGEISFSVP